MVNFLNVKREIAVFLHVKRDPIANFPFTTTYYCRKELFL